MSLFEKDLSEYNSKTVSFISFCKYIDIKNSTNKLLYNRYKDEIFRKYKWYGYINRQKSVSNFIQNIKNTYTEEDKNGNEKEIKLIIGNWSIPKQLRNFISTPNIGLKRKLAKHFDVYDMDEYKTSCISNVSKERCENLYLPDKKGKYREMHPILTYKMWNNRIGCMNRDINAVKNIRYISNMILKGKERPKAFKRQNL